jgi:hypothetical protein
MNEWEQDSIMAIRFFILNLTAGRGESTWYIAHGGKYTDYFSPPFYFELN